MWHKKGNKIFHGWKASKYFHYIDINAPGVGETKDTGICHNCEKGDKN